MDDILKNKKRNLQLLFITLCVQAVIYIISGSFFDFLSTYPPAINFMTIIAGFVLGFMFNGLSTLFPIIAFLCAFFCKNIASKVAVVLGMISSIIGLLWLPFGIIGFFASCVNGNNSMDGIAIAIWGLGHLTAIITLANIKLSKV